MLTNPYHVNGLRQAFDDAIDMPRIERTPRIRSLRRVVSGGNILRWAAHILGRLEHPRHEAGVFGPRRTPASR